VSINVQQTNIETAVDGDDNETDVPAEYQLLSDGIANATVDNSDSDGDVTDDAGKCCGPIL